MNEKDFEFDGFCDRYKQEKLIKYLAKLQEQIDYPKIKIQEKVDKQGYMCCLELRLFMNNPEKDIYAIQTYRDEREREFVIGSLLREVGYRYIERAYEYWKGKEE